MCAHAKSLDEASEISKTFTLQGIADKLTVPLLFVHSQGDTISPYENAMRIARETRGPVKVILFPEGNHVCDNIPYKVRPLMADWMARELGLSAAR
jgi:2,6-dihydroxypseudooxynicotine hydrolase